MTNNVTVGAAGLAPDTGAPVYFEVGSTDAAQVYCGVVRDSSKPLHEPISDLISSAAFVLSTGGHVARRAQPSERGPHGARRFEQLRDL